MFLSSISPCSNAGIKPRFTVLAIILLFVCVVDAAYGPDSVSGTLVVAVPVKEGLVVCSDKRLFNSDAGTFTDNYVKIRKVNNNALFVATNTVGFYDRQTRTMAFDAFELTTKYVATHDMAAGKQFWDGLKKEIRDRLLEYFAKRKFAEWPESDKANNNLLFNLVFYTIRDKRALGYTLRVFYEKAKTPVIYIPDPISEQVRTPKLSGKGREVMTYLARNPAAAADPVIQRFDETRFNLQNTTATDAVGFARKLFQLTSTGVPQANVSPSFDCALLDFTTGFRLIT
jgi:hypothetical protein